MMNLKNWLAAASALALMAGVAHADENFVNVEQNGSDNDGIVTQGPGNFNKVGTANLGPGAALQNGKNNKLTITQTGSSNEVGTSGKGFDQIGNHNTATIEETSSGNSVREVQQRDETRSGSADRNMLTVTQGGSFGGNSIDSVWQTRTNFANSDPGNSATITQASNGNSLSSLVQEGRGNTAELTQKGGYGNHVGTISQRGTSNNISLTFEGWRNGRRNDFVPDRLDASSAFVGLVQGDVTQIGRGNKIDGFVVAGNRNAFGFYQNGLVGNSIDGKVTGDYNQFGAYQNGNFANAHIDVGGDFNEVYIRQDGLIVGLDNNASAKVSGSRNGVSIAQYGSGNLGDVTISGSYNLATAEQDGLNNKGVAKIAGDTNIVKLSQKGGLFFGNDASITITGNSNSADISQTKSLFGAANRLELNIYGDRNNSPSATFTRLASRVATAAGLTPGRISQTGADNSITMNVGKSGIPADGNLFAFLQDGISNTIKGSVMGSGNQVVVVQGGNSNFTSFSQNGNFNMIGIDQ